MKMKKKKTEKKPNPYGAPLAMTRPVTLAAPFCFKAWAQASKVAPVVKMSSQSSTTLIQSNDNMDFEHHCVHVSEK